MEQSKETGPSLTPSTAIKRTLERNFLRRPRSRKPSTLSQTIPLERPSSERLLRVWILANLNRRLPPPRTRLQIIRPMPVRGPTDSPEMVTAGAIIRPIVLTSAFMVPQSTTTPSICKRGATIEEQGEPKDDLLRRRPSATSHFSFSSSIRGLPRLTLIIQNRGFPP